MWKGKDKYGNTFRSLPWDKDEEAVFEIVWREGEVVVLSRKEPDDSTNRNSSNRGSSSYESDRSQLEDRPSESTKRQMNVWRSQIMKVEPGTFLHGLLNKDKLHEKQLLKGCLKYNPMARTLTVNCSSDEGIERESFNVIKVNAEARNVDWHILNFWRNHHNYSERNKIKEIRSEIVANGILWKYSGNRESYESFFAKLMIWKRLILLAKSRSMDFRINLVGSTGAGFSTLKSDLDLCLTADVNYNLPERDRSLICLHKLYFLINRFGNVTNLSLKDGQLPFLKFFVETEEFGKKFLIQVKIYCNNDELKRNSVLLSTCAYKDLRVQPFIIVLKQWLYNVKASHPGKVFISAYSLTLMAINFLQCAVSPPILSPLDPDDDQLEGIHQLNIKSDDALSSDSDSDFDLQHRQRNQLNKMPLGDLFLEFFNYYSSFDLKNNVISVRLGRILTRDQYKDINPESALWPRYIAVEDPNTLKNTAHHVNTDLIQNSNQCIFKRTNDILSTVNDLEDVFKIFKNFSLD